MSLGGAEQNYPPTKEKKKKQEPFSPHKHREVVGVEGFKSEISPPETLLLFARSCRSMYFLLQYFLHLKDYFHTYTCACTHSQDTFFVFADKL